MRCHSRIRKIFTTSSSGAYKASCDAPTTSSEKQAFNEEFSLMVKNFNKFFKSRSKERRVPSQGPTMRKDLLVVIAIAIIVEDPDNTPMSVRLPTKEEKTHLKGEAEEKNHLQEKEGVEMIVMNEDPLTEERTREVRTSHQRAKQDEEIKLIMANGYPVPTPTTTPREVITPTLNVLKMKVLRVLHLCHPTTTTYWTHQMKVLEDASWIKAPRYHTPSMLISILMKMIC